MTLRARLSAGLILCLVACGGDDFEADGDPGGAAGTAGQGGAGAAGAGPAGSAGQAGEGGQAGQAGAAGDATIGAGGAGAAGAAGGAAGEAGAGGESGSSGQSGASGEGGEGGAGGCATDKDCGSLSGPCRSAACNDGQCVVAPTKLGQGCPLEGGFCDEQGECTVPQPDPSGCGDGQRDGLLDASMFPDIAACAGAWSKPGIADTMTSSCGRHAGDDRAAAEGCSALDLCSAGWHVCRSATEVSAHIPAGSATSDFCPVFVLVPEPAEGVFYATGQSGTGNNLCTPAGTNDLFGCGTSEFVLDSPTDDLICSPFNAVLASNSTPPGVPWTFDSSNAGPGVDEKGSVIKLAGPGGVLCCRD